MKVCGTRLWPQEAEESVLGAILCAACWNADAGLRVLRRVGAAGLHPSHFWLGSHARIYEAMLRLSEAELPVDPVSVAAELDREHEDAGAVSRLRVLAHQVSVVTACERHTAIVLEAAERREIEERAAS